MVIIRKFSNREIVMLIFCKDSPNRCNTICDWYQLVFVSE